MAVPGWKRVLSTVGFRAVHFNLGQHPFRAFGVVPNAAARGR
jgi:hypothetical protein